MGCGTRQSPISPTGSAVCGGRKAKHPLARASGVIPVLCVLHSILQLPKQNTSCWVVILQGTVCIVPWVSREDLLCVCACVHFFFLFFFSIFFPTRRMFKLTLVVAEWGRTMGLSHDVCREKQGRAWSAAPGTLACSCGCTCTQSYRDPVLSNCPAFLPHLL